MGILSWSQPPHPPKGHKVHSQRVVPKIKPLQTMYSYCYTEMSTTLKFSGISFIYQYSNIHKQKYLIL